MFFRIFRHVPLSALVAFILTTSASEAQSFDIPGGSVSISQSGRISGGWTEVNSVPGFPDEVDSGSVSGRISANGNISGSFSGTDTYNTADPVGGVTSVTEQYSGSFSGTIDRNGNYSVSWGGPEPGSTSGNLPGYSRPGPTARPNSQNTLNEITGDNSETRGDDSRDLSQQLGDFTVEEIALLNQLVSQDPNFCP